jgi:prevent-host-death family protein
MATVALFEAKTRLSELLVQVQRGEEIVITRHGVPMARLVPPSAPGRRRASTQRQRVDAAFEALAGLRQGASLDIPLRQAIDAGRD